jgi:DNA-binding GntR family transcriptional regulator
MVIDPTSTAAGPDVNLFEPLGQQTTPVAVYERLRRAILDGRMPAGSPLREAHIAKEFGISRSPLREALHRLEEEGLAAKIPYRGTYVAQVSKNTIAEIARVRMLVEPYVAEQALPALRGEQRLTLLETVDALRRAARSGDPVATIDAHLSFHGLFYQHCGNELLGNLWLGWQSKLQLFFIADHSAFDNPDEVFAVHGDFIDAVLNEDVDGIRDHVIRHIHGVPDHT